MKIIKPITLRSRISIFNAVFISCVLLISLILVYFILQTWLYRQVDNSLKETANEVTQSINLHKLDGTFKATVNVGDLERHRQFVRIVDLKGHVKKHWGPLMEISQKQIDRNSLLLDSDFLEERKSDDDYEHIRVFVSPINSAGKAIGYIQVGQSTESIENMLQVLFSTLLIFAPLTFILTLICSRWLTGRALAPLSKIAATAERISDQELHTRLDIPGEDEVARLATSLDHMLDRLEIAIEGYRQFTGDASHELRTPLTIMKGEITLALQKERNNEYYVEVLAGIEDEVDRLIRMVEQLLFLARADSEKVQVQITDLDLYETLTPLLEQIEILANRKNQNIKWVIPKINIVNDPNIILQIFLSLLDNAVKYTPESGTIQVNIEEIPNVLRIGVSDTGHGISEEHLTHIFDRFYRVDKGRSRELGGTGLGLAIAQKLALLIGGSIKVKSTIGKGTTFYLEIPYNYQEFNIKGRTR